MPEYIIKENSPQYKFIFMRSKIQLLGGAYANGKTTSAIMKAIDIAIQYPGSRGLIARADKTKLRETVIPVFNMWCPPDLIKSFPQSANSELKCTFTNGSTITFNYLRMQGKEKAKSSEDMTLNVLSASYDYIVIDQVEDPQLSYEIFIDLLGRLRGNTKYAGTDPTMPITGPRWLILTCNPNNNWVYKKIVKPFYDYKDKGIISSDLLVERHSEYLPDGKINKQFGKPVLKNGKPILLIDIVEGSTYTNAHNLGSDFIKTLESTYTGAKRQRFLLGKWAAYEGLVYPEYSEEINFIDQDLIINYIGELYENLIPFRWIEAYDYGITNPSCYLIGFADRFNNIIFTKGFYKPTEVFSINDQKKLIMLSRQEWMHTFPQTAIVFRNDVLADPSIFKKTQISKSSGSYSIASLFMSYPDYIPMEAADNNIEAGITKVQEYFRVRDEYLNPFTKKYGSPKIFFNNSGELDFIKNEITEYLFKKDAQGRPLDKPQDGDDHAMDCLKYFCSVMPTLQPIKKLTISNDYLTQWSEESDF